MRGLAVGEGLGLGGGGAPWGRGVWTWGGPGPREGGLVFVGPDVWPDLCVVYVLTSWGSSVCGGLGLGVWGVLAPGWGGC